MSADCKRFDPIEVLAWVEGEGPALPGLEAHLAACEACRARVESLSSRIERLRDLPPIEPPAELWVRIARRRPPVPLKPTAPATPIWARAASLAGVAAAVALAATLALGSSRPARPPEGLVVVEGDPSLEALSYMAQEQGGFFAVAEETGGRGQR